MFFCLFSRPEPASPREPRRPRDLSSERDRRRNEDLERAMEKTEVQVALGVWLCGAIYIDNIVAV